MSWFDPSAFAQAVLEGPRAAVGPALVTDKGHELAKRLDELAQDVEATLGALAAEHDPRRVQALRQDLAVFLPARRAAILSAARSRVASDARASFEAALDVTLKAVVSVARAFVTRGL